MCMQYNNLLALTSQCVWGLCSVFRLLYVCETVCFVAGEKPQIHSVWLIAMTFGFQLLAVRPYVWAKRSEQTPVCDCVYLMLRQQENTISKPKLWLSQWLSFHCIDLLFAPCIHGMPHAPLHYSAVSLAPCFLLFPSSSPYFVCIFH